MLTINIHDNGEMSVIISKLQGVDESVGLLDLKWSKSGVVAGPALFKGADGSLGLRRRSTYTIVVSDGYQTEPCKALPPGDGNSDTHILVVMGDGVIKPIIYNSWQSFANNWTIL